MGVGAWDLYHGHVVVPGVFVSGTNVHEPRDAAAKALIPSFAAPLQAIDMLRASMHPETLTNPQDLSQFTAQLSPILASLTQPLQNLAATGLASIYYHSFETSTLLDGNSRYAGFQPADPRRNWVTPIGHGTPAKYASADHPNSPFDDFFHVLEIAFLVDKDGVVRAVADTKEELVAATQQPFTTIA